MIRLIKYQNKGQIEGVAGKWYLRVANGETIDLKGLAKHMSQHNCPYSRGVIDGVLTDMADCIKELLLDNKKIKLNDIGILSLGIHCKGADTPENCIPANIVGYRFNFQGSGELTPASIKQGIRVKEQEEYSV